MVTDWLLSQFSAHRQLQRELDAATREVGHWRAESLKWEARCETARAELLNYLRDELKPDQPAVEREVLHQNFDEPINRPGKQHARALVQKQTAEFLRNLNERFGRTA